MNLIFFIIIYVPTYIYLLKMYLFLNTPTAILTSPTIKFAHVYEYIICNFILLKWPSFYDLLRYNILYI